MLRTRKKLQKSMYLRKGTGIPVVDSLIPNVLVLSIISFCVCVCVFAKSNVLNFFCSRRTGREKDEGNETRRRYQLRALKQLGQEKCPLAWHLEHEMDIVFPGFNNEGVGGAANNQLALLLHMPMELQQVQENTHTYSKLILFLSLFG